MRQSVVTERRQKAGAGSARLNVFSWFGDVCGPSAPHGRNRVGQLDSSSKLQLAFVGAAPAALAIARA